MSYTFGTASRTRMERQKPRPKPRASSEKPPYARTGKTIHGVTTLKGEIKVKDADGRWRKKPDLHDLRS